VNTSAVPLTKVIVLVLLFKKQITLGSVFLFLAGYYQRLQRGAAHSPSRLLQFLNGGSSVDTMSIFQITTGSTLIALQAHKLDHQLLKPEREGHILDCQGLKVRALVLKQYFRTKHGGSCLYSQLFKRQRSGILQFQASPGKQLMKPPSQTVRWAWWYGPVISAMQVALGRRIWV
jgi:hypothetical protein